MKSTVVCIAFLLVASAVCQPDLVLFASGTGSTITNPAPPHSASLSSYTYPTNISGLNGAKWIWDGKGWNVPCPLKITVQENYQIQCPGQDITFQVTADNRYNFTFGSVNGSGSDWRKIDKYTIKTPKNSCGKTLTMTVDAQNDGTNCNGGNPAALIYSATTPDCTQCASGSFFVASRCACVKCSDIIVGCLYCSAGDSGCTGCTTCDTRNGFELVGSYCLCRKNFTYNPTTKTCTRPVRGGADTPDN